MNSDTSTFLDLGSSKLVGLVAQSSGAHTKICAVAVEPCKGVRRGIVADFDAVAECADAVLRRLEQQSPQGLGPIAISISGAHVEGSNARGMVQIYPSTRSVTREDMLQVLRQSQQQMLPADRQLIVALPKGFAIDGQRGIQQPIGMKGGKLEAETYLLTGQTSFIRNSENVVECRNRQAGQLVVSALASGLAVLTDQDRELGAVSVDIGSGTTDIAIFSGASLAYAASIPIGGGHVTSDLSNLIRTSPDEAERLKCQFGAAFSDRILDADSVDVMQLGQTHARPLQRKVLCEIIESRMRELVIHVRQHLEKSGLLGQLPGGITLTGGASLLPGTIALFETLVKNMPIRLGASALKVPSEVPNSIGTPVSGHSKLVPDAGFSTAIGMALFAFSSFEDELVPAETSSQWKGKIQSLWSLLGGKA